MKMRLPAWIAAVSLFGVLGPAIPAMAPAGGVIRHAPIHVHRNEDGSLKRGVHGQAFASGNWSGYEVATWQPQTNANYYSATLTWVVPKVVPQKSGGFQQASVTWVGIGGFCANSSCSSVDNTLIQLGTEQDVYSFGSFSFTNYYAWYELIPAGEVQISGTVKPGDVMTASLTCTDNPCSPATTQHWKLTMTNNTRHWTWTSPSNLTYTSSLLSAEWIEEAPSSFAGTLPLADFGTMELGYKSYPTWANGSPPTLSLDTNAIVMENPYGQTSEPSSPNGADHFNVCWDYQAVASCSPPSM
jgi:hypothetical protein